MDTNALRCLKTKRSKKMIPQEYPPAIINGANAHSTPLVIPGGFFPKDMKRISQMMLNRNAPVKEHINLAAKTIGL